MARKRIRRYYRRKGRWSANIKTLTNQNVSTPRGSFFGTTDLCQNPIQIDTTVSQQYTVKNVEVSFMIETAGDNRNIEGLTTYIMFVPQGMTVTETYPNTHPEYIMAYRFLGSPDMQGNQGNIGRNPLKVKTRLSRRLQTGDKIIMLIVGQNPSETASTMAFSGIVRWWTKAN